MSSVWIQHSDSRVVAKVRSYLALLKPVQAICSGDVERAVDRRAGVLGRFYDTLPAKQAKPRAKKAAARAQSSAAEAGIAPRADLTLPALRIACVHLHPVATRGGSHGFRGVRHH